MENPKIRVKVVHSQSKTAWNIVGERPGCKYKIARIPYFAIEDSEALTSQNIYEALLHAKFIAECFNNSDSIVEMINHSAITYNQFSPN